MDFDMGNYPLFPPGTTLRVYSARGWLPDQLLSGAPIGSIVTEAVVASDGTATFSGLTENTRYYVVGQISGAYHYLAIEPRRPTDDTLSREEIEEDFDTSGTPADGSVTAAKVAPANVDGAAGTPGFRSLVTVVGNDNIHAPTALAVQKAIAVRPSRPPSGSWTFPRGQHIAQVLATAQKGNMFLLPVDVAVETEYKAIAAAIETTVAAGTGGVVFRLGYYADDGTGSKPTGLPLFDAGTVSAEAVGTREIAIEKKLAPGRYWLAFVMQATTVTTGPKIIEVNPVEQPLGAPSFNANNFGSLRQEGVAGALPEIGALVAVAINPLVGLQVK